MKLSILALNFLVAAITALPTATSDDNAAPAEIAKRATVTDAANGYASLNGGTTGGKGGTTTTVSTYAQFTAAVSSDTAKIVIVSGTITATADQVKVGSNTSIIGKNSSAKLVGFGL
jgi:pectate lyase